MTPAAALAEVIQANLPNLGYPVFQNHAPDSPDNVVCIYEIGRGRLEGREMRTGIREEHPLLHVAVRGKTSEARDILQQISDMTETVYHQPLSGGGNLQVITKSNTIGFAGQETQTRRYVYTQQFRLTLE